jgi:A/G-specific adenine glycosylase
MGNKVPRPKRHARDKWAKKEAPTPPSPQEIGTFVKLLLIWYLHNARQYPWREETATLYQKVVAEILLQRTRADTVASFLPEFYAQFPSWKELSTSDQEDLHQFLYPLGLWKQKAKALQDLANEMVNREGQFPNDYNEIRGLPGVGQYIANAIALFNLNEPRPLLDVNMARVLERYFGPRKLADIRDDPYLQNLAYTVVLVSNDYTCINFAILDLAALICKKKPLCYQCPIKAGCKYWRQNEHM